MTRECTSVSKSWIFTNCSRNGLNTHTQLFQLKTHHAATFHDFVCQFDRGKKNQQDTKIKMKRMRVALRNKKFPKSITFNPDRKLHFHVASQLRRCLTPLKNEVQSNENKKTQHTLNFTIKYQQTAMKESSEKCNDYKNMCYNV